MAAQVRTWEREEDLDPRRWPVPALTGEFNQSGGYMPPTVPLLPPSLPPALPSALSPQSPSAPTVSLKRKPVCVGRSGPPPLLACRPSPRLPLLGTCRLRPGAWRAAAVASYYARLARLLAMRAE